MLTIEQTLNEAEQRGEAVNVWFEERLVSLVSILHKIAKPLTQADIEYERGASRVQRRVGTANAAYAKPTDHSSPQDRVHVQVMDAARLISPAIESVLPADLQARLREVRDSE